MTAASRNDRRLPPPHGGHDAKAPAASGDPALSWQVFRGRDDADPRAPRELEQPEWRFITPLYDAGSWIVGKTQAV